nr:CP52k-like protein 17 [Membranobalanus longirostrum]
MFGAALLLSLTATAAVATYPGHEYGKILKEAGLPDLIHRNKTLEGWVDYMNEHAVDATTAQANARGNSSNMAALFTQLETVTNRTYTDERRDVRQLFVLHRYALYDVGDAESFFIAERYVMNYYDLGLFAVQVKTDEYSAYIVKTLLNLFRKVLECAGEEEDDDCE